MTTLITGAGLVGSLAAARLIAERDERPVLYDVGFTMQNLAERGGAGPAWTGRA